MLRNRFRRSYWYRNVANVALVLLEHTWKYAILKLHLKLLKLHLNILKLHRRFQNTLNILENFRKKIQKVRKCSTFVDFFQIFQKVFPRIPGGCRHQESAGNRVLDIAHRRFSDSYFWNCWDVVWKHELFQIVQTSFLKKKIGTTL